MRDLGLRVVANTTVPQERFKNAGTKTNQSYKEFFGVTNYRQIVDETGSDYLHFLEQMGFSLDQHSDWSV